MALLCGHRVTEPARKAELVLAGECPACAVGLEAPGHDRWVGRCGCCRTRWVVDEGGRVLVYEQG